MGLRTEIQWADGTVNGVTGCDGCELWSLSRKGPCYAGHLHESRLAKALPALYSPNFTEVRLAPGRMAKTAGWSDLRGQDRPGKPWLNGLPRLIFVGDMGDLFSKAVPFEFIHDEVVATAASAKGSRHVYMLLTKQPSRMAKFGEWLAAKGIAWPENLWAGTSVTSNKTMGRVNFLKAVPAAVRFISFEPLWEAINFGCEYAQPPYCTHCGGHEHLCKGKLDGISWVIVGGQSDQGGHETNPFDLDWARRIIRDCRAAGVPAFIKQLGSRPFDSTRRISIDGPNSHALALDLKDRHGGDWWEWDEDLRVREMPALEAVTR